MDNRFKIIIEADNKGRPVIKEVSGDLRSLEQQAKKSGSSVSSSFDDMASSGNSLRSVIKGVGGALAGMFAGFGVSKVVELADSYTMVEGRLRLVTSGSEELASVQKDLLDVANRSRSSFLASADVYSRFGQALKGTSVQQGELLNMTETLNKAFIISGASIPEQTAAMMQLGQAMASGVLRGEEFNSVSENGSRIMQMLVDYTGNTRGELRAMAAEGKLTADVLRGALAASIEKINEEFKEMPMTVGQAGQHLGNSFGLLVDNANKASGATKSLAGMIDGLASKVEELALMKDKISAGADFLAGYKDDVIAIGAIFGTAVAGQLAFNLAVKANPYVMAGTALIVLNEALKDYELNIGSLTTKWNDYSKTMGVLTGNLDEFGNKISDKSRKISELEGEINRLGNSLGGGSTAEKKWWDFKLFPDLNADAKRVRETTAAIKELQAQLDKLRKSEDTAAKKVLTPTIEASSRKTKVVSTADQDEARAVKKAEELQRMAEKNQKDAEKRAEEVSKYKEKVQGKEIDRINALIKAEEELSLAAMTEGEKSVYAINQKYAALNKLILKQREAGNDALDWDEVKAKIDLRQQEDLQKLVEKTDETTGQISKIWEHAYENLQDITSDWLYNLEISWDSLKDLFKKTVSQMVSAWMWGQARMKSTTALAGVGGVAGTATGASASTGAGGGSGGLFGSGISLSSLASSGTMQAWGVSGINSITEGLHDIGLDAAAQLSDQAGAWLNGLSSGMADGMIAGVGSLAMSLLSGKGVTVQTGLQAAGAAIGSLAGPIGAFAGGIAGNFLGGLFGKKENKFTLSELEGRGDKDWNRTTGIAATGKAGEWAGGNEWYRDIQNTYNTQRDAATEAFNQQVEGLKKEMSQTAWDTFATALESTSIDFSASGRWKLSDAEGALKSTLEGFNAALGSMLDRALTSALPVLKEEIKTNSAFSILNASVQSALVEAMDSSSFDVAKYSNLSGFLGQITAVTDAIDKAVSDSQLDQYEIELSNINSQFSAYSATLKSVGVDLARYTVLEAARVDELSKVYQRLADEKIAGAEDNLRKSFADEEKTVSARHLEILKGLNGQLSTASSASSRLSGIVSGIKSTIDGMRLSGSEGRQRTDAQATLKAMLEAARAGNMSGMDDLGKTLSVLSEPSEELFASFTDYQRDYLKTYESITELEGLAGSSLDRAKQTVDLIEKQIEQETVRYEAERVSLDNQLNSLLKIDNSVLSVAAAIAELKKEQEKANSLFSSQSYLAANKDVDGAIKSGAYTGTALDHYRNYGVNEGRAISTGGKVWNALDYLNANPDLLKAYAEAKLGMTPLEHYKQHGIAEGRSFASGTDYVPYDMKADIHKGERITPAAYNRSDATNAELVEEIKTLRKEMADSSYVIAKNLIKIAQLNEQWDVDGQPEVRAA